MNRPHPPSDPSLFLLGVLVFNTPVSILQDCSLCFGKDIFIVSLLLNYTWDYSFTQLQIHVYSFRNYLLSARTSEI